jgi:K+-transporting ATPase A subunit
MTPGWLQIVVFFVVLLAAVRPLGGYMYRVFSGSVTPLSPLLRPVEAALYWLSGVAENDEQDWYHYALAFLIFHLPGILLLYGLLRLQHMLPLNPAGQSALSPDLALNTAVSFATNTSWESYGGETTLGRRPRSGISPRWRGSRFRAFSPPRPGLPWRSRSAAVSPAAAPRRSAISGWI